MNLASARRRVALMCAPVPSSLRARTLSIADIGVNAMSAFLALSS